MSFCEFAGKYSKQLEGDKSTGLMKDDGDCTAKLLEDSYTIYEKLPAKNTGNGSPTGVWDSTTSKLGSESKQILPATEKQVLTPAQLQQQADENRRQQELSDKVMRDLSHGRFGDRTEQEALLDVFRNAAGSAGRQGEQAALNKFNNALHDRHSQFHLEFGQNIIKTPGGRRLQLVDRHGRVSAHVDFVVPPQI